MAAPKKTEAAVDAAAEPAFVPKTEAQAIAENQAIEFRAARTGKPTVVLPGGARVDATPFIQTRYTMNDSTQMFGSPESIVGEDFRREHQGWKYMWPKADALETQAYIRGGHYKPVPFEAIDKNNINALVFKDPATESARWMQHVLVAVPPNVWHMKVTRAEEVGIANAAMNRQMVETMIQNELQGFKGEFSVTDRRQEK